MASNERVRGVQVHRPIIYGSVARLLTEEEKAEAPEGHTHRWTIFLTSAAPIPQSKGNAANTVVTSTSSIDAPPVPLPIDQNHIPGGADDLSYLIKKVTFKLHETIPNPSRVIDKPPFQVTETGWGEFPVPIRIQFISEAAEKPLNLQHFIRLHHWGPPIEAVPADVEGEASQSTAPPAPLPIGEVGAAAAGGVKEESGRSNGTEGEVEKGKKEESDGVDADGDVSMSTPDGKADRTSEIKKDAGSEAFKSGGAAAGVETAETAASTPLDTATPAGTAPASTTAGDDNVNPNASSTEVAAPAGGSTETTIPASTPTLLSIATRYPVHAWQYDELVFSDPLQTFLTVLNANTPTPLPVRTRRARDQREDYESDKRRKKGGAGAGAGAGGAQVTSTAPATPSSVGPTGARNTSRAAQAAASSSISNAEIKSPNDPNNNTTTGKPSMLGILPITEKDRLGIPGEPGSADVPLEFSQDMERGEWNRLNDARIKIIEEMDRWREILIERETEARGLREQMGRS